MSWSDGMVPGLNCFVTMAQSRQLNTWSTLEICVENKKWQKVKLSFFRYKGTYKKVHVWGGRSGSVVKNFSCSFRRSKFCSQKPYWVAKKSLKFLLEGN